MNDFNWLVNNSYKSEINEQNINSNKFFFCFCFFNRITSNFESSKINFNCNLMQQ